MRFAVELAKQKSGRLQFLINFQIKKRGFKPRFFSLSVTDLKDYIKTELKIGQGITVTYSNGAKVPTDKYAEMLARTTRTETQNIAMVGKALDDGNDLVECSTIFPTCDVCAKYQGRIYSISGNTPGYPALYKTAFKNGYSCIHPNCRHQFFPYNPKFHTEAERKALEEGTRRPWDSVNQQSEAVREAYARSQMQMRQWNKEMNRYAEYKELCAERGEDSAYKNLGSFRRAYRSKEGTLAYAKSHYYRRDEKEFAEYESIIGKENLPKTLEDFQQIKYNKDRHKYAFVQIEVDNAKIRRKLGTVELPLTIQEDKQGKHIKGHKNFTEDKSYLAVETVEDGIRFSQEIVEKYHGKGEIQRYRNGDWKHTERITTNRVIGFAQRFDGEWIATKSAMIHYSKNGTHIVPTLIDSE